MSAEALKLRRHRATWMLVWIFPIGAVIIPLIALIAQIANELPPSPAVPSLDRWYSSLADFWDLPPSGLARFLVGGFVAVVFAGEYGWNTWKLIVPHRSRTALLAAKYLVALGLLYAAFLLAAPIVSGLTWLEDVLTGDPIPNGISVGGILGAHAQGLVAGLPVVLFTIALISFASIMTRSTTAAIIIGIVWVTLEQLFQAFGPALAMYLAGPVEALYQILPGYHLSNLRSWMIEGEAFSVPFPPATIISYDWSSSLAIAGAWIAGLTALTFWRFRRQDIN
jgi:ABC-type transport system involved in multi-copper enzyme maturation permease subunit